MFFDDLRKARAAPARRILPAPGHIDRPRVGVVQQPSNLAGLALHQEIARQLPVAVSAPSSPALAGRMISSGETDLDVPEVSAMHCPALRTRASRRMRALLLAAALAGSASLAHAAGPGECTLAGADVETADWHAWYDLMPPKPDHLYATGQVIVANPGVEPLLRPHEPPGINPAILMLDLYLCQMPGVWPQVMTQKPVRYETEISESYMQVHVLGDNTDFAVIDAETTH